MKKFLIVTLAVLFGMGMMAGNARADSYDPTGAPGFPPLAQLGGTLWNHGGIGDALYGQMYRAVESNLGDPFAFVSYISIENVSNNFVAAHVRLRSGRYSIEVRDFPILLSPRDVFWFQFEVVPDGAGGIESVRIFSNDIETLALSGLPSGPDGWDEKLDGRTLRQFKNLGYTEAEILEEMTQGYIEVFGLFELPRIPAGNNVIDIMNTLWNTSVDVDPTPAVDMRAMVGGVAPMDVQKSLAGHVFMGDFQNGLYFGYTMDAIKDFRTDFAINAGPRHRDISAVKADGLGAIVPLRTGFALNGAGVPGGLNSATAAGGQGWYNSACILYNYGQDHAYSNPDWATNFGPTWNDGDDFTGGNQWGFDSWSLDEIDDALVKQRIQAPYFNGGFSKTADPASGTYTLAAVTFGTKYLHYFYDALSGLVDSGSLLPIGDYNDWISGSGRAGWPVGYTPMLAPGVRNQMDVEYFAGQVTLRTAAWDLAENTPVGWSPFTTVYFPWELNFIAIGDLSIPRLQPFCFLMVDQIDAPYGLLRYEDGYFAGQVIMEGFALYGVLTGDPRTVLWNAFGVGGYDRGALPLLGLLQAPPYNDYYILPASVLMMDWEFTNFSHARSYKANWDNLVLPADYEIKAIQ
jgi:hypothetical protein